MTRKRAWGLLNNSTALPTGAASRDIRCEKSEHAGRRIVGCLQGHKRIPGVATAQLHGRRGNHGSSQSLESKEINVPCDIQSRS